MTCNGELLYSQALEFSPVENYEETAQLEIRIIEDITGDGFVDVFDLFMAARAYGSHPRHSRWLPAAGLNLKLMIEIGDVKLR